MSVRSARAGPDWLGKLLAIHRRVVGEANTHQIELNVAIAAKEVISAIYKLSSRTVLFEVIYIASIHTFCVTKEWRQLRPVMLMNP